MLQSPTIGDFIYMQIERKYDFDEINLVPIAGSKYSSRSEITFPLSKRISRLIGRDTTGIIAANMDGVGTFEVARVLAKHKSLTALHKHYPEDKLVEFFAEDPAASMCFYSTGINLPDKQKLQNVFKRLGDKRPNMICVDVANGYMERFPEFIKNLREYLQDPSIVIMAGNLVPGCVQVTESLINAGVDILKIGIGPSAVCLTRKVTGIGYPQFDAIRDMRKDIERSFDTVDYFKTLVCSDGGCKSSGDVAKAYYAGADCVMLGSMLAGTDQGGGLRTTSKEGVEMVQFYGMSSNTAQKNHNNTADYRASEGRTVTLPAKGDMESVIGDIIGGLRSTMTYAGCESLQDISMNYKAIQVSGSGGLNNWFNQYTVGN